MNVNRGPEALARLVNALGEPTRRAIYDVVREERRPLSRSEVAGLTGTSTRLAAFHLDRLVDEGLLVAHFARPPGRRGGPGAGRPAKWYTPANEGFEVTVPPRRNDIAAQILLRAARAKPSRQVTAAMQEAAREIGAELARGCHSDEDLDALLVGLGYEPTPTENAGLDLVNCPFHELVAQDQQSVCSMNLAMLEGAVADTDSDRVAKLEPRAGFCCVRLLPDEPPTGQAS